jgi:hypothetical protein
LLKVGFEQGKGSGKHVVFPLGGDLSIFLIFSKKRRPEGGSLMGTVKFLPGLNYKLLLTWGDFLINKVMI